MHPPASDDPTAVAIDPLAAAAGSFQSDPNWIFDAATATGVHRDNDRPCSCGCRLFVYVLRKDGSNHIYCSACYRDPRFRLHRKGDVEYANRAAGSGVITYRRPPADVARLRERNATRS